MRKSNSNVTENALLYGEVFTIWSHLNLNNGFLVTNQSFSNFTRDADLMKIIDESIQSLKDENTQLERLLKVNGMTLSPIPVELNDTKTVEFIPTSVCVTDAEISAALSMNIATSLVSSSQAMEMTKKKEVAMMYGRFHMKKAILGAKLLQLSKNKGWIPPSRAIS